MMKPGCGPEWSSTHAILFDEADRDRYIKAIDGASIRLVSAVTRVEMSFVVEGRKREAGRERLERFFNLTATEIVAVTPQQAIIAIGAFRNYGKGRRRTEYRRLFFLRPRQCYRPSVAVQGEWFCAYGYIGGADVTSPIPRAV